jgi:hypothetical protein
MYGTNYHGCFFCVMPDIFFYRGFCTGFYVGIKTDHFASESQKRFVFGCVNEVVVAVVSVCNTKLLP